MRPYKIFSIAMVCLLFFGVLSNCINNFENNNIYFLILDNIFSFIFPAIIFFTSWLYSYIDKENNISLFKYYFKILINFILPYILCMIPYIIYEYGINNLTFNELINIILKGNMLKQFTYLKTFIGISLAYPAAKYFLIKNTKNTLKTSFALSAIFSLFNLGYFNIINYLFYLCLGISFSYYRKELYEFFNKKTDTIYLDFIYSIILIIVTNFYIIKVLNPIARILYSTFVSIYLAYGCHKVRAFFIRDNNYLHTRLIFNPPIIGISVLLLFEIIIKIISDFTNTFILTIPGVFVYFAGISFVCFLFIIERRIWQDELECFLKKNNID